MGQVLPFLLPVGSESCKSSGKEGIESDKLWRGAAHDNGYGSTGPSDPQVCGEVSVSGSTRPSPSCVHIVSATLVFQEMMGPIPTYFAWQRKGNQALV